MDGFLDCSDSSARVVELLVTTGLSAVRALVSPCGKAMVTSQTMIYSQISDK